jgi:hypothetical protein
MPSNRDIRDFFELRNGFEGMIEFTDAALRFLDRSGIATSASRRLKASRVTAANGNGHGKTPASVEALREKVKARFVKRKKKSTKRGKVPRSPAPAEFPVLEGGSMAKLKGAKAVLAALAMLKAPVRGVDLGTAMKAAGYKGSKVAVGVALPALKKKKLVNQDKNGRYSAVS